MAIIFVGFDWTNSVVDLIDSFHLYQYLSNCRQFSGETYKMPTQVMNDSNSANTEIKVKTAYNGEIMITYINENISYDELCNEIRGICRFSPDQVSIVCKNICQYHAQIWKIRFHLIYGWHLTDAFLTANNSKLPESEMYDKIWNGAEFPPVFDQFRIYIFFATPWIIEQRSEPMISIQFNF